MKGGEGMSGGFEANPEGLMEKGNAVKNIYSKYMDAFKAAWTAKEQVKSAWEGADSAGYISAIDGYEADFKKLGEVVAQLGDILYRHGSRLADSRDAIKAAAAKL